MSIVIKDREKERNWDAETYRDDRPREVTVRRYKVPDRVEEDRHSTFSRRNRYDDGPRHPEYRDSNVREYRFERDVSHGRPEAQRDLDEYRSERARSPGYREVRVTREVSRSPPRREAYPYELDHYTKTTDYYARERDPDPRPIVIRQEAPQPIIIREEAPQPLVIREREERPASPRSVLLERQREEEREERKSHVSRHTEIDHRSVKSERRVEPDRHTEIDRRTEINEDRTIARREEPPPPVRQEPEDEYYYQRTTRQVARDDRDDYDDYKRRRDDRRPRREDDVSDDEYYYKRVEKDYSGSRHRSKSRHRLDVAEGAVAGLAGAALMNRNRKKKGEDSGGLKNLVGGAALGAVSGEAVNRARSRFGRDDSRSRSRSRSYERQSRGRRHRHDRSRSRSHDHDRSDSKERLGKLGQLGAVAAIGALAGYAASRKKANKDEDRRSRSRVRRSSRERSRSSSVDSRVEEHSHGEDARNSKHRNSTMAKAGVAGAAVAGVVDRVRSKSRGGGRSKSRVRQGLPIAAAGLGSAALAGLYENNKAKKEKKAEREASATRSRSRSRAHQMSTYEDSRDLPAIEYGGDPIPPGEPQARPRSRADSYYSDYGHGGRRSPDSSSSRSPRRRRYGSRSRSRGGDLAEGAGAGLAGSAAHDASKRRDRRRAERERRRQEEVAQEMPPQESYGFGPYGQDPPPLPPQPEYPEHYFHNSNAYAAPTNAYSPVPQFVNQPNQHQQAYGAPFPPPGGTPMQEPYGYQPGANRGPYQGNHVSDTPHASKQDNEVDVNVEDKNLELQEPDPLGQRKAVQFDLSPEAHDTAVSTPELSPRSLPHSDESDNSRFDGKSEPRDSTESKENRVGDAPGRRDSGRKHHHRSHGETEVLPKRGDRLARYYASSEDSGDTEVLPDRFDKEGRKIYAQNEDPLTDRFGAIFDGQGPAGRLFSRFASDLVGPSSGSRRTRQAR